MAGFYNRAVKLSDAQAIVDFVVREASGPVSVFVADSHGELVAAATMDGAAPDTRLNAQRKAYTAARSDARSTRELAAKAHDDAVEREIGRWLVLSVIAAAAVTIVGGIVLVLMLPSDHDFVGHLYAFLVVIAGGLGQLRGAIFAALALGLLNSFVQVWTDASIAKVVVFLAVIAFLQFRPQGLFVLRTRSLT